MFQPFSAFRYGMKQRHADRNGSGQIVDPPTAGLTEPMVQIGVRSGLWCCQTIVQHLLDAGVHDRSATASYLACIIAIREVTECIRQLVAQKCRTYHVAMTGAFSACFQRNCAAGSEEQTMIEICCRTWAVFEATVKKKQTVRGSKRRLVT